MDDLRVLIIDDHALLGESLARFLGSHGMQAVWCGDIAQAMQFIREQTWSVVLLDLSMPQGNGLDLLKRIKLAHPALPVLILSMHPEQQFALRALRGGAGPGRDAHGSGFFQCKPPPARGGGGGVLPGAGRGRVGGGVRGAERKVNSV